jgi:hypothetical protein
MKQDRRGITDAWFSPKYPIVGKVARKLHVPVVRVKLGSMMGDVLDRLRDQVDEANMAAYDADKRQSK